MIHGWVSVSSAKSILAHEQIVMLLTKAWAVLLASRTSFDICGWRPKVKCFFRKSGLFNNPSKIGNDSTRSQSGQPLMKLSIQADVP
jgi:hypothetical protein